jgi:hypothetical protein
VGVAHGHFGPDGPHPHCFDGRLSCYYRLTHICFELKLGALSPSETAGLQTSAGEDGYLSLVVLRMQIRCYATSAVAGDLGLGAVGIEELRPCVSFGVVKQPLDSIGADSIVTIA